MFSTCGVGLYNVNLGPAVTGVGSIGPTGPPQTPNLFSELSIPWHDLTTNPSLYSLLSWHTNVADFSDRATEMQQLEQWAESAPRVSVKFLTGGAGIGKSRLAAEFAEQLRSKGWSAGFARLDRSCLFAMHEEGTLLIIDYPEEQLESIREILVDLSRVGPISRLRVLLLTRQRIDDWLEVVRDCNAVDIVEFAPVDLGSLDGKAAHYLYCSALERAAEALGTTPSPVSETAITDWLQHAPENDRPLFILAAAVHSALCPADPVVQFTGRDVIKTMADREIDRLRRIAQGMNLRDPLVFARVIGVAAIAGGVPVEQIKAWTRDENLRLGFETSGRVVNQVRAASIVSQGVVLAPQPDILAAAFTVRVLAEEPEIASELIWTAMEPDPVGGLERLARLSYDAEILLGMHEYRLGKWLADAVSGKLNRCRVLRPLLSEVSLPVGLMDTATAVWTTLLEHTDDVDERAGLLNNLSNHLSLTGDAKGALKAIRKAVKIRRKLAEADPARFEPELAMSLNNLSVGLNNTGDTRGALKAIREVVEIRRKLAKADRARFEPDLAMTLNNLSVSLRAIGDTEDALEAVKEAMEIYRKLAQANPVVYEPDLARSLNNLSNSLDATGDRAGALEAIKEAVEIRRKLAQADPAVYEPDLAMSLNNLSNSLDATGDRAGAFEAIKEAVEIYRKLAQADPVVYEPDLAMSLNNLSNSLDATGDRAGALEAIKKAVEIYRKLAQADPVVYEPDLAMSLNNLSNRLDATGDGAGALEAIKKAVEIRRKLAQADPAVYEPDLAMSLNNLSNRLDATGDGAGALEAIKKAVEIRRKLAQADPVVYEPDLAMSLNNLSNSLDATGDGAGALEAIKKAVEIRRKLAQADPAVYEPDLAMSLNNLSNSLDATGDRAGALEAIKKAVEIRRKLAQANPVVYEPDLARSLGVLATILVQSGATKDAAELLRESIKLIQPYAKKWPHGRDAELLEAAKAELADLA